MNQALKILLLISLFSFIQKNDVFSYPNSEYLDWETFKINNQLPLLCKKVDLINLLGNADSIKTPHYEDVCSSYFDAAFTYLFFGKSQFESSGNMAVVSSIDLESGKIKLVSPMITLDNTVTLEKIKKILPMAVKNAALIEVDKEGKMLSLKVATSKKETDDAWLLFFKNGKLVRIDHWIPC